MTAFDVMERRIWDGQAASYARTAAPLCVRTVPALLDAAGVTAGTRLLDVGCGTGSVTAAALARGAAVRAVDAEPDMVAATRRSAPAAEVRAGTLPRLPYEDAEFDAVVGNFVLNHVGRPLDALVEMRRVARPGGRIAVTVWQLPGTPGQTLVGRAAKAAGLTRPDWLATVDEELNFPRTPDGLAALLKAAGFADVRGDTYAWDHRVDPEEWWAGPAAGIGAVGGMVTAAGPEGAAAAKREYDALCREFLTDDGLLALPHAAVLVQGSV
ncbi:MULTISPECIES: class I SAM-dependent methyltransferase [unclassified Streptomyces]|uniref:class I SAM-dependent methyltransferase n=1 Tax=unclassified Streptomyces TaxID=2593676 RepID=UPI000DAB4887|nr:MULTISPECIES: class I SAM-dependent methyltransferase [unclassified Streptomyces]PZT72107.1 SAM-dependent methyltransferase [Streptomyces sp. AC1-42T]PZT81570.1 SAM-dependent methyltransferase [Streptomyces sp. AC1-42W]